MPGPYVDIRGLTREALLAELGGYTRANVRTITPPKTTDGHVDAEAINKMVGGIADLNEGVKSAATLIASLQAADTTIESAQTTMQAAIDVAVARLDVVEADILTLQSQITSANGYRIDVTSYGVVLGAGVSDAVKAANKTAVDAAIAAADSLKLGTYFPAGTCCVLQSGAGTYSSPQGFLIAREDAEVFGAGMHASIIVVSQSAYSVYTHGFKFAHGYNARIHDLKITNDFTEPPDENQAVKAGIYCLNNTGTSTTKYTVTVERCYIEKWHEGIASDGGSYDNHFTVEVIGCDLRNWILGVQCFAFGTSNGTKSVHVFGGYMQSYDKASNAASHCMYIAPNANLRVVGVKFDNWQNTKVAIKHYGQSGTGYSTYAEIIGCQFGEGGDGYAIVCGMFCPTVIADCHFNCRAGIEMRGLCTVTGCFFTPRPTIAGTIACFLPHAASDNDIVKLIAKISHCTFDFSYVGANSWTVISSGVFLQAKWYMSDCDVVLRAATSGVGFVASSGVTGTGGGAKFSLERVRLHNYDDPANGTFAQFMMPQSGTWDVRDCGMSGDAKTGTGNFRCTAADDLVELNIDGWDQRGSTLGIWGQMDSTASGKVAARSMRLGTNTSLAQMDCTAGYQRFRLREDVYPSTVTAASSTLTAWAASTAYRKGQLRQNDTGKEYRCTVPGTSASSGGPTGTGAGIIDGGVTWDYVQTSTTHRLVTLLNDYNEYEVNGVVDSALVNGRFNDQSCYEGARMTWFSGAAGTLQITALGNMTATVGTARAAGTRVEWRYTGGLWVEV